MNKNRNKIAAMMMVATITVSSVAMPAEAIALNVEENIIVERNERLQARTEEIKDVAITEENFPDEEFRNKVIQIADQMNEDNPILSADKIRETTELDLYGLNIENLQGIGNFKTLKILDCASNNLTSLDLSENKLVEDVNCVGNSISQINLSGCSNLIKLNSAYNSFETIDLSACINLQELYLRENNLKSLDLSQNVNLQTLEFGTIDEENLLEMINFGEISSLQTIKIKRSLIKSLNLKNMSNLTNVEITSSPITELDLSGCDNLQVAEIYFCGLLEELNCGNSTKLTKLDCSMNRSLKNLDVSNNTGLKELNVAYSGINYINLKNQSLLEKVYIEGSNVSKIDLNPNVSNSIIDGELAKPDGGNGGGSTNPDQKPEEKPNEKPNKKHEKIIGSDRYETAAKIADKMGSYNTVILVNSDKSMADGLSAASLSGKKNAPILLVKQNKIPKATMDRINKANNVYIVGGENAISKNVEKKLKESGKKINRIAGKDRYDTSREIAKLLGGYDKAFIVNGAKGEADAMSVSAVAAKYGAPILLTNGKTSIHDKKSGVKYYAIGGTSVIDNKLKEKYSAERVAGSDRYATNREIMDEFYWNSEKVYFAKGDTLIDALTASALAKDNGIVLVSKNKNHSELEGKDTVQVGGMNFEIDFE